MRITKSFRLTVVLSAVISVVCFIAGFLFACRFSLQTGAAVVTAELCCFALASVITAIVGNVRKKKRGKSHEM